MIQNTEGWSLPWGTYHVPLFPLLVPIAGHPLILQTPAMSSCSLRESVLSVGWRGEGETPPVPRVLNPKEA